MKKTCLVVDDVKFDRKMLMHCAAKMGFDVIEATNGKEALALCRRKLPDCIVVDWEMPGMEGVDLLEELRELDGGEKVCALMCTSYDDMNSVGHAYKSGAYGFINKPVSKEKLQKTLEELRFFERHNTCSEKW